jgi:probable phosphoglycerate mutase
MDGYTQLLIARHAEAWCNREQTIAGPKTCRGLTPTGRRQAARLAAHLASPSDRPVVDVVYSSPLPRTRETAAIIAAALHLPVAVEPDLREPDYGSADGQPWTDVVKAFGAAPALHPDRPIAPGAEPWTVHLARVRAAVAKLLNRHRGARILLVGHGETVTAAHHHFLHAEPGHVLPMTYLVDHASLTTWQQRPISWTRPELGPQWALNTHNDTAYLTG